VIRGAVMGKQKMRQAARLAASQAYAKRRREQAQRDRRRDAVGRRGRGRDDRPQKAFYEGTHP
jgi:hypothetical protein